MTLRETKWASWALALLSVVILSNLLLYQTVVQQFFAIELEDGVVFGSLIDLVIISPVLASAAFKLSKKQAVGLMVFGLVIARVIIPEEFFTPYTILLYSGIGVEALFLATELGMIFLLFRKIPVIRTAMRSSGVGPIYSFMPAVERKVSGHPMIRVVSSELLMVYYAFFSWRSKSPVHDGVVTMHQKTSSVAMNIMLIHAVVIETIGLHWWLHSKVPILSLVLLILNVYSVLLVIAEIQITRLHPLEVKDNQFYVVQGLRQRLAFPLSAIDHIEWGTKPSKDTMIFMHKDFEEIHPQAILFLKDPVEATMFMGRKKKVSKLALRVDEPERLKQLLEARIGR
ncbi:beta-carotene 15,15'-monooxygenase [Bacillus sp. BHET2]|uniref:beta-carotene 15,15'-monooxygenase n=1 Tax=Bacillus sp. BHET2 TaxID=2583818 RepID=UPI00110D536C|nr:beta-carotene 15,15'-monooxygenase [Bacillus sp. BHET2]TMU85178.1 beta-carotene 15,15'-monooxygenase [Bacillus sp. BHET2]